MPVQTHAPLSCKLDRGREGFIPALRQQLLRFLSIGRGHFRSLSAVRSSSRGILSVFPWTNCIVSPAHRRDANRRTVRRRAPNGIQTIRRVPGRDAAGRQARGGRRRSSRGRRQRCLRGYREHTADQDRTRCGAYRIVSRNDIQGRGVFNLYALQPLRNFG